VRVKLLPIQNGVIVEINFVGLSRHQFRQNAEFVLAAMDGCVLTRVQTHGATNYGPDTACATSGESEVFLQSQTDTMTGFGNIGSQTTTHVRLSSNDSHPRRGAMGSLTLAAIAFAFVFVGGAIGLELQRRLPEGFTTGGPRDMTGAVVGLMTLLLALVLGLLIWTAYGVFLKGSALDPQRLSRRRFPLSTPFGVNRSDESALSLRRLKLPPKPHPRRSACGSAGRRRADRR
jgi:hypothetical protein